MIKKFKNGKILLKPDKNDFENGVLNENFYHDEMLMSDLYINQINGYQYIVDFNTLLVYEIGSYLLQNPLKFILETLEEDKKIYLYPLSKKESKSLLQDLENGY